VIAKDLAQLYNPIVLVVAPVPGVQQSDGSYLLPNTATEFSLAPAITDEGAVPNRGVPPVYYAELTSADAPSTVVRNLQPGDAVQVTLTVTTAYETQIRTVTAVVAP